MGEAKGSLTFVMELVADIIIVTFVALMEQVLTPA